MLECCKIKSIITQFHPLKIQPYVAPFMLERKRVTVYEFRSSLLLMVVSHMVCLIFTV